MNIIEKNIKDIKPYENNPRNNEGAVEKVAESIKEFGFQQPIVVDKDNVVIVGHTRLKAAERIGLDKVPVVVADELTKEQAKAYRLADNKTNEIATWKFDVLNEELLDIGQIDMSKFGFDMSALADDLVAEEDDYIPDENIEPKVKQGDIWQLGEHRLMCGDSTSVNDVEALLGGVQADMVFTDPPYGMNLDTDYSSMKNHLDMSKEKRLSGGKKYSQGKVDDFAPEMIDTVFMINAKETFLWGADYFAELLPDKNDGSWIVWDKRANGNNDDDEDYSSDKMYGSCFELCWSRKRHKRDIARIKWAGVFGTEKEFDHKRWHPTQKPVKLSSWFLERYSEEQQVIVDIFGGSGSTLIACEQLNRKCYMMELDPHYCTVIIDRWESFTGQKAIKING